MKTFCFFRLRFRRAYDSAYDSDFRFSLGHKHKRSYDSVASEKQSSILTSKSDNLVCFLSLQWLKKSQNSSKTGHEVYTTVQIEMKFGK